MATVSKEAYQRLIENRPYKFDEEEVNYRLGIGTQGNSCSNCAHFYTREVDKFHTCEIFRPDDDSSIKENYICDFWDDGKEDDKT